MLIDIIIAMILSMITYYIIGSLRKKNQRKIYNQLEIEEKLKYKDFREYSNKKNKYNSDKDQAIFFGCIIVWTIIVVIIKINFS